MVEKPERWILEEIKLMDPELYPYYFSRYRKWMIVKDFPRRLPGITDYDPINGKNFIVEAVVEDSKHNPLPLDAKVVKALRRSLFNHNNKPLGSYLEEIDREEEEKAREMQAEARLMRREAAKKIHKFQTSETFVLGGK